MTSTDELRRGGQQAAEISNAVVKIVGDHNGRGPTRARTYIGDDVIAVVLEETLTRAERTLVDTGRARVALEAREALHAAAQERLVGEVERISGRHVTVCLAAREVQPDVTVKIFLLEPEAPPRATDQ
ncbi:MAG: DUF2294 family protein [Solirubrobacteraceae bacterium]|nr:DUF2294 family protein [Solirubrobacteraceae bacterium]